MSIAFKDISQLNEVQLDQYRKAVVSAFPEIVRRSPTILKYWSTVEKYFPKYQVFVMNEFDDIVGFINSIPFNWQGTLDALPREGWDWMLMKGIDDHENDIMSNSLGGLQIIVASNYLGQGYSKVIINKAKKMVTELKFDHFVIPIRPTYKSRHPRMPMSEYVKYRLDDKIYDPWIRTHLKGGAEIISICDRAMHVYGNIDFWKSISNQPFLESGEYIIEGALNPISIDLSKDYGEYFEDNIWISYS